MTLQHLWPDIKAEIIHRELEELASNFEGAGPDAPWTGQEVADAIRERIKNHPDLTLPNGERA